MCSGLLSVSHRPRQRVNYTKAALYVSDGYMPFSGVTGKFLCSTISISAGNPVGPEDPALQMGAGIATSLLGRLFRLTREHMRLIAPVGAAAGASGRRSTRRLRQCCSSRGEEVVAAWRRGRAENLSCSPRSRPWW
ncbi:MAG: chloride channel protein [Bryobacterales bacterium]